MKLIDSLKHHYRHYLKSRLLKCVEKNDHATFFELIDTYNYKKRFLESILVDKDTPLEIVKVLLLFGIDVNATNASRTALFDADTEKTKVLIKHGIDVNKEDMWGNTALFYCSNLQGIHKPNCLYQSGANLAHKNHFNLTAEEFMKGCSNPEKFSKAVQFLENIKKIDDK